MSQMPTVDQINRALIAEWIATGGVKDEVEGWERSNALDRALVHGNGTPVPMWLSIPRRPLPQADESDRDTSSR